MYMEHILRQIKKYLVKIVCSVSCVVASGDVMIDSGQKPLFLLTIWKNKVKGVQSTVKKC